MRGSKDQLLHAARFAGQRCHSRGYQQAEQKIQEQSRHDAPGHPIRPACVLIRRWRESLSLPLHDAADLRAEGVIQARHRADPLEMEDRLPQPTGPLLEVLEASIPAGLTVTIDYSIAAR